MGMGFIAKDAHGAKAEAGLALEPWGKAGHAMAGADEEGLLLAHFAKGGPEQQAGQHAIGPEQDDVEGGDEGNEEEAGDVAGVLGDEQKEEQAADGPGGLAEDDGQMLEDGALVEHLADADGAAKEIAGEEAEYEGQAVGIVTGQIDAAIGSGEMGEDCEPGPKEKDHCRALKRNEERLNSSNAVGNHGENSKFQGSGAQAAPPSWDL